MRSTFSSSPLVRLLGEWAAAPGEDGDAAFAQRLGDWVSAFDAIGLQAAQQSIAGITAAAARPRGARRTTALALQEDIERARAALATAIARDPDALPEAGYAPYQRRHLELQRQMEQVIGALRAHVRQALSQASAALRQLAALDEALDAILSVREQALLPMASHLLERRFTQLRSDGDAGEAWRAAFETDWRAALRAEVDLRLEPVRGMAEALASAEEPLLTS